MDKKTPEELGQEFDEMTKGFGEGSSASVCSIPSDFEKWWHNEGSGMPPKPDEDQETHVKRIAQIAWDNGAYKAREDYIF